MWLTGFNEISLNGSCITHFYCTFCDSFLNYTILFMTHLQRGPTFFPSSHTKHRNLILAYVTYNTNRNPQGICIPLLPPLLPPHSFYAAFLSPLLPSPFFHILSPSLSCSPPALLWMLTKLLWLFRNIPRFSENLRHCSGLSEDPSCSFIAPVSGFTHSQIWPTSLLEQKSGDPQEACRSGRLIPPPPPLLSPFSTPSLSLSPPPSLSSLPLPFSYFLTLSLSSAYCHTFFLFLPPLPHHSFRPASTQHCQLSWLPTWQFTPGYRTTHPPGHMSA